MRKLLLFGGISLLVLAGCGPAAQPSFTAVLSPDSATVSQGQSASTSLTITPQDGFTGTVNLALQSRPEGVSLTPSSVVVSGSSAQTFSLNIATTSSTPVQLHNLVLLVSQGSLNRTVRFDLTVSAQPQPNFTVSLGPPSGSAVQGGTGVTATLTVTPQNGFSGAVGLRLENQPAGVTVSPSSITLSGTDPQNFPVTFNTTSVTPTGPSALTLVATQGSLSRTASFTLTVTSFSVALTASSTLRAQGQSFSDFDLTLTPVAGFGGTIALSLQSPPSGISITPASLTTSGPITLSVGRNVVDGVYNLTLQASSGGLTRTTTLTLRVLKATTLASGGEHALAVKPNGEIWAWGRNSSGQLGYTTAGTFSSAPLQLTTFTGAVSVAAGEFHSLALLVDGTVRAWGGDGFGELGDGSTDSSGSNSAVMPVTPSGLNRVVAVAAGRNHSLALLSDGTMRTWGRNDGGQLGDGTTTGRNEPVSVAALDNVIALAGGTFHSLALRSDGTIRAWGDNFNGQLGDGTNNFSYTPVQVSNITNAVAIAAGDLHSLALLSDGAVGAWGNNAFGQLGNDSTINANAPVAVSGLTSIRSVAAGLNHSLAVLSDGSARAWGADASWQLGNGSDPYDYPSPDPKRRTTPVAVLGLPTAGPPSQQAVSLTAGFFHSLALLNDGSVMGWGNNDSGQIGNNSTSPSNVPVISAITGVQAPPAPAP